MRRPVTAYPVALAVLVAAVLLRWLLDPVMGDRLPLVTMFGAVSATVWLGGYGPALVVGILGYLACAYLFIAPRGTFGIDSVPEIVGLVAYLFTCSLIIAIGEALRTSQARAADRGELFRVTLASIGDAVITTDNEGRVTYLNAVAETLTGWINHDALGQPLDTVFRIYREDDRQPVENPAVRALREGVIVGLANHTVLVAKGGAERYIDDSAAPIKDERGRVSGCVLIFRDISERRRAERNEAIRMQTTRLLASIVESSDDAILSKSLDGTIQSWNAGAERLFGYSAAQAVNQHISLIIPPDRIAEEDRMLASLRDGHRVDHLETERLRSDGTRVLVSLTVSPLKDGSGAVVGASKIARDITRQRQVEADREKFVTLAENSTDFIAIFDTNAVPIYVNPAGLTLIGLGSIEQARRIPLREFFFPEDQVTIIDEFLPSVAKSGHGEIDVRFRNFQTGEARWMAYKVLKLTDAHGQTVALATVSQDVTERRRMQDDLRKMAADLSEMDRRKNEFLATLAHELRNPLAPLSTTIETLQRRGGDDTTRDAVATMERQVGQLVRLVDDLLDLNRITYNRLDLRKVTVDLVTLIQEGVHTARTLPESAGKEIRMIVPAEPIHLHADPIRLAQVFGNLLHNSCKYTSAGGSITITAERDGSTAVVSVKDTGAGIPPDKLDSIFEMFTRVDRSLERSRGGLGIGLTLVRQLVEMHGGSIEASSGGENQGSEFVVRLPIALEIGEAMPHGPVAAQLPGENHRILVVDDNHDAAASLAMLLAATGHESYTAHDGPAALEAAAKHRPDVVLLDIGLPTLSGYDVCRHVREQPWGRKMVLVALTGWGQDEDRRRSHEAGFDGHLVKPVDYNSLMALLGSLVKSRRDAQ